MDYEGLSSELVRALRGKRSCAAISRRLGYRSNAVYTWEQARAFPTASDFLRFAERLAVPARPAVVRFYGREPPFLEHGIVSKAGVAAFLRDQAGERPILDIARSAKRSRFSVSRWLAGVTEPKLPDFLRMVDVLSLRLLDFVACFVDPALVPAIAKPWKELESSRTIAYEHPLSHVVLRALELDEYRALASHSDAWLAKKTGIAVEDARRYLSLLQSSGQVRLQRGLWRLTRVQTVDTRRDPDGARRLQVHWSGVAVKRLEAGCPATLAYNLFTVSSADLDRIRELQRAYFRELRAIVAASTENECVVLAIAQLLSFEEPPSRRLAL